MCKGKPIHARAWVLQLFTPIIMYTKPIDSLSTAGIDEQNPTIQILG